MKPIAHSTARLRNRAILAAIDILVRLAWMSMLRSQSGPSRTTRA